MTPFWTRQLWCWLAAGLLLRLVAIDAPNFGNSNLRQTQTAVVTQSIAAEGGLALGGKVTWLGDREPRLLMEPPLYNYLVLAIHRLDGDLDRCGKIASVLLWAVSFLFLQDILRRLCTERARRWASYLFLVAPLSVYFGQAFMPEMLIQCLGLGFVALLLRYVADARLATFASLATVGAVGMLMKGPEISHLYLLAALVLWRQSGWRALFRVRYFVALALTLAAMRLWSVALDQANAEFFPEWTSAKVMHLMLGSWAARFDLLQYGRLAVYIVLLITTVGGAPLAILGVREVFGKRGHPYVIAAWILSAGFAYVLWAGAASRVHGYYHLPTLVPACLAFGIGCERFLRSGSRAVRTGLLVAITALPALALSAFLFTEDRTLEQSTTWLREHTGRDDLIVARIDHRTDMATYRHYSTISYYAQRRVWPAKFLPDEERTRASALSAWALITEPRGDADPVEKLRRWFKRMEIEDPKPEWPETDERFEKYFEGDGFTIYRNWLVTGD